MRRTFSANSIAMKQIMTRGLPPPTPLRFTRREAVQQPVEAGVELVHGHLAALRGELREKRELAALEQVADVGVLEGVDEALRDALAVRLRADGGQLAQRVADRVVVDGTTIPDSSSGATPRLASEAIACEDCSMWRNMFGDTRGRSWSVAIIHGCAWKVWRVWWAIAFSAGRQSFGSSGTSISPATLSPIRSSSSSRLSK